MALPIRIGMLSCKDMILMIDHKKLRNTVYSLKFALQGGVHDNGDWQYRWTAEEVLDELLRRLNVRPVSIKPFYTIHWDGDSEVGYGHIKSHLTGRRYEVEEDKFECDSCLHVRTLVSVNLGTAEGWAYANGVKEAMDLINKYEIERGISHVR